MYHDASRRLQDRFDTRRLADRLAEKLSRTAFTEEDSAFIASQAMFFFATADADGWPECSYKGGVAGFVASRPYRRKIRTVREAPETRAAGAPRCGRPRRSPSGPV